MLDELNKIDIKALRSFIAIAECKGVTAAQTRLNLSPSVISNHLTHLESELDMVLCERGRSGFMLTEDGKAVYEACLSFQEAVAGFRHQLHFIRQLDSLRGVHIRLSLSDQLPDAFHHALQATLAEYYDNNPALHVSIRVQSPEGMSDALLHGDSDIGVGFFTNLHPALQFTPAFYETQVVCCGKNHPLFDMQDKQTNNAQKNNGQTKGKHIENNNTISKGTPPNELHTNGVADSYLQTMSVEKLENEFAWVERGYGINKKLLKIAPKRLTATAYHMEATAQIIMAGHHLGYLPLDYAQHQAQLGNLRILFEDTLAYDVEHHWAHRPKISKPITSFMATLKQHLTASLP